MSVAEGVAKAPLGVRKPGGFLLVFLPALIVGIGLVALVLSQLLPDASSNPTYGIDELTTAGIPAAPADPIVMLDR